MKRVRTFTSLGSPHLPPPEGSAWRSLDQTRGLLRYVDERYPGAFLPKVQYTSVVGTGVGGALPWDAAEGAGAAAGGGFAPKALESLVGFTSYLPLSGDGEQLGDGIVPVSIGVLPGSREVLLDGVRHANFVPSFPNSISLEDTRWYGSEDVLPQWISALA